MSNLALTTVVLGLGGVFVALIALAAVVGLIKRFVAPLGERKAQPSAAARPVAGLIPAAPVSRGSRPSREEEIAAAIAVGLHLDGIRSAPGEEVAAAIAAAFALHQAGASAPNAAAALSGWSVAGRLDLQGQRFRAQLCRR
jgi:sodium pump decarboxylase gamma subunit